MSLLRRAACALRGHAPLVWQSRYQWLGAEHFQHGTCPSCGWSVDAPAPEIPEEHRKNATMMTFTGRRFSILEPRVEDVVIEDIAHALSMQCRFAGHPKQFYSVAQHSVLASEHLDAPTVAAGIKGLSGTHFWTMAQWNRGIAMARMAALLHDASEAYAVDLPRPIKRCLREYGPIEARIQRAIGRRFLIEYDVFLLPEIKAVDDLMLAVESRDLMHPGRPDWEERGEVPWRDQRALLGGNVFALRGPKPIEALLPMDAERLFLDRFHQLRRDLDVADLNGGSVADRVPS